MTSTWLISVGAGRWQLSGIRAALGAGIRVLAIDGDPTAVGFSIADYSIVADIRDPLATLDAVRGTNITPSGAVSFVSDAGMKSVGVLREFFDLPGARKEVIEVLTDKCAQRTIWTIAGLPSPRWLCASAVNEALEFVEAIDAPVIVKPIDAAGSRGISVVTDQSKLNSAFKWALAHSRATKVIVEEFIIGIEYTVETFSSSGWTKVLAVSEKRKVVGSDDTVALELATPNLPDHQIELIAKLAVDAIEATGYAGGPAHTEIIRDHAGRLYLVETAGRGGGFMVADGIVTLAAEYDLAKATALQAVGIEPPNPQVIACRGFALRFIPALQRGQVARISGFSEAQMLGDVYCEPLVNVGDCVGGDLTDAARLAYVLTLGVHRQEALELMRKAEALLTVEIDLVQ